MSSAGRQIQLTVRLLSIAGFLLSVVWLYRMWVSGDPLNKDHFEPSLAVVSAVAGFLASFVGDSRTPVGRPPKRSGSIANLASIQGRSFSERVARLWLLGYCAAILSAVAAYGMLLEPLKGMPWLVRPVITFAPLALVLFGHTVPAVIDKRRRERLKEISGELKFGYFRLSPREQEESFTRADNKHEEILRWLKEGHAAVLYLTGQSGSGKSSILSAWVFPQLAKEEAAFKVIQLRGYQDPLSILRAKLCESGVVWSRPPADTADVRQLLERSCEKLRRQRLLLIFDQFEEFVILHDSAQCQTFANFLASLVENPIHGLTVLLVLRSDYVGILENLSLPKLFQDTNWKEVPPFTEQAARRFLRESGLTIDDDVERHVLREAAEIEQARGLIRPVTLNLCGLVLGRFASGLPHGLRPGGMIRGFVRECVELPQIRDVTPKLIPQLISNYVTKRPRTIIELANETGLDQATIRGCLRVLGQLDRGIVRPLDREQERWEISHDFLVPLLDAVFARWSVSFWRRTQPYLPWLAAASMALVLVATSLRPNDAIQEANAIRLQQRLNEQSSHHEKEGHRYEAAWSALLSYRMEPGDESFKRLERLLFQDDAAESTGLRMRKIAEAGSGRLEHAAISLDGVYVALVEKVRLRVRRGDQTVLNVPLNETTQWARVSSVGYAAIGIGSRVLILKPGERAPLEVVTAGGFVTNADFSADGRQLYFCTDQGVVGRIDVRSGEVRVGKALQLQGTAIADAISLLTTTWNGSFVTATNSGRLHLWDATDLRPKELALYDHPVRRDQITAMAVSRSGKLAVARTSNHEIEVWDLDLQHRRPTEGPLRENSFSGPYRVRAMGFRADGQQLVTDGNLDSKEGLFLIDRADTGFRRRHLLRGAESVKALAFGQQDNPPGEQLMVLAENGKLQAWYRDQPLVSSMRRLHPHGALEPEQFIRYPCAILGLSWLDPQELTRLGLSGSEPNPCLSADRPRLSGAIGVRGK